MRKGQQRCVPHRLSFGHAHKRYPATKARTETCRKRKTPVAPLLRTVALQQGLTAPPSGCGTVSVSRSHRLGHTAANRVGLRGNWSARPRCLCARATPDAQAGARGLLCISAVPLKKTCFPGAVAALVPTASTSSVFVERERRLASLLSRARSSAPITSKSSGSASIVALCRFQNSTGELGSIGSKPCRKRIPPSTFPMCFPSLSW